MGMGVGAFKAPFFGSVVDKNKGSKRMRFPEGFHVLHFQARFGYWVNENEIKLTGVFGNAVGDEETWVRGFKASDFLLEGLLQQRSKERCRDERPSGGLQDVLDDIRHQFYKWALHFVTQIYSFYGKNNI